MINWRPFNFYILYISAMAFYPVTIYLEYICGLTFASMIVISSFLILPLTYLWEVNVMIKYRIKDLKMQEEGFLFSTITRDEEKAFYRGYTLNMSIFSGLISSSVIVFRIMLPEFVNLKATVLAVIILAISIKIYNNYQ